MPNDCCNSKELDKSLKDLDHTNAIQNRYGSAAIEKETCLCTPVGFNPVLLEAIPDASIDIKDLMGDNNHYSAIIKSGIFKGMSKIDQHKLVYKSLKGKMGNELHALSLTTEEK